MENYQRTIEELRAARLRRGLAQAEIAKQIGTTQSAIARLEATQSDPRFGTVARYAESVGYRLSVVPATAGPRLATVGEDVASSLAGRDPDQAFRHIIQFLDDLGRTEPSMRRQAISEEPEPVGNRQWDALIAGIAEYASQRFGFAPAGWTAAPGRFLERFWFVIEDLLGRPAAGLAAFAFANSPAALASRGVFLDPSSLRSI